MISRVFFGPLWPEIPNFGYPTQHHLILLNNTASGQSVFILLIDFPIWIHWYDMSSLFLYIVIAKNHNKYFRNWVWTYLQDHLWVNQKGQSRSGFHDLSNIDSLFVGHESKNGENNRGREERGEGIDTANENGISKK